MTEQTARVGAIDVAYESFGEAGNPTILLIMGLGVQMLGWDEGFCASLVAEGFQVVRFDNRDVGRSTWMDGAPPPDLMAVAAGELSSASYRLEDMADDAAGLLDHLDVGAAHVVGASMGGMIAQTLAIRHPERVLSLTSIMSTTGDRAVGHAHPDGMEALMRTPPNEREGFGEAMVKTYGVLGSPGYTLDEDAVRERALASFDRGHNPLGVARQLVGIVASGDRTEDLKKLQVPTLVVHGTGDVLIDPSGGEATAAAIPEARLELIDGMGHDLPRDLWPRITQLIAENAARAAA